MTYDFQLVMALLRISNLLDFAPTKNCSPTYFEFACQFSKRNKLIKVNLEKKTITMQCKEDEEFSTTEEFTLQCISEKIGFTFKESETT